MRAQVLPVFLVAALPAALAFAAAEPRVAEFINERAPYPECHAATIAETSPGHLVAAWFGGTKERNPDVCIWVARREDGRWLEAVNVASGLQPDGTRYPTWNPVLFQPRGGPLVLFYKVGPAPTGWWGMMMTSPDGGRTWGAPRRLPDGVLGPIKNPPVLLPDGGWLCPSSTESVFGAWRVHFELTRDAGRTWRIVGPVGQGPGLEAIQPAVLVHRDGRLQALCRTKNGVIATTWSADGGAHWSALATTSLPNPDSGIDALTLADGRQLLVYNHAGPAPGQKARGPRCPLDVALSDDGVTWRHVLTLESAPCPNGYAYPTALQSADGLVHIVYTWDRRHIKYVVIDPRDFER